MATWLEEHGVELVVLAGYMHLLTAPFLARFPDRIVNVHPSCCRPSRVRTRSTTRSPPTPTRPGSPSTTWTKGSTPAR